MKNDLLAVLSGQSRAGRGAVPDDLTLAQRCGHSDAGLATPGARRSGIDLVPHGTGQVGGRLCREVGEAQHIPGLAALGGPGDLAHVAELLHAREVVPPGAGVAPVH
ncbi:hypothetical protein FHS44_008062 [Streptosporangium saharense]|uniref:Uncharacterized protein n=1 Tax=Streptosporangium saharense TaxID=1706840 RepID=A0A7W7VSR9_9ACTN|nr:hypothetical protein [Streptosporangium saharense]